MYKRKPHKGLQKRVRVSARGKLKRRRAGTGHLLSCKRGKRRRQLRRAVLVSSIQTRRIRRMLTVG